MSNTLTSKVSGRMSSRGWAIALGIGAIVLAAILLVVYLDRYRARVGGENAPTPVLVAKQLHPGGNARATLVASEPDVRADDAPAQGGRGRGDLRSAVPGRACCLRGDLPGPAVHGRPTSRRATRRPSTRRSPARSARSRSRSTTSTGASRRCRPATRSTSTRPSRGVVKLFRPNVKVLTIPAVPGPSGGGNLILRIETKDAATFAYAADNTQLCFVLRPVVGAKPTKPSTANASTVLR